MTIIRSIIVAISMYSTIPMPRFEWDEKTMRYNLAAFPIVGVFIGLLLWAWITLCNIWSLNPWLSAIGLTFIPLIISGGIHLDGFSDTVDAISSHAEPAKKREILKDSHVGAFAVMGIVSYLLIYFVLSASIQLNVCTTIFLCLIPFISRCLSGFVGIIFKGAKKTGMLAPFRENAAKLPSLIFLGILIALYAFIICYFVSLIAFVVVAIVSLLISLYVSVMSKRQFGGMSGDISGFYLSLIEILLLCCLVVLQSMWLI